MWHKQVYDYIMCSYKKYPYPPPSPHFDCIILSPGGNSTYERGGDARRKFWIKPLKETDLGLAQAFFKPLKETMLKHDKWENLDYMNGVNKTN